MIIIIKLLDSVTFLLKTPYCELYQKGPAVTTMVPSGKYQRGAIICLKDRNRRLSLPITHQVYGCGMLMSYK